MHDSGVAATLSANAGEQTLPTVTMTYTVESNISENISALNITQGFSVSSKIKHLRWKTKCK